MPFRSAAQRKYLWIHDPVLAEKFSRDSVKGKKLPQHVKKKPHARRKSVAK